MQTLKFIGERKDLDQEHFDPKNSTTEHITQTVLRQPKTNTNRSLRTHLRTLPLFINSH